MGLEFLSGRIEQTRRPGISIEANDDVTEVEMEWGPPYDGLRYAKRWKPGGREGGFSKDPSPADFKVHPDRLSRELGQIRVYSLNASKIALPHQVNQGVELGSDGSGLSAVADALGGSDPDRFSLLNRQIEKWFPDFDHLLFDPKDGAKSVCLRVKGTKHKIPASDLSQGTLVGLALLTLSYLPEPPKLIGLEEIDRGMHPRLLRDVRDALFRLCYPEQFGDDREPVQVVATTHSPYFLDLFKDHPEDIVIAERTNGSAVFRRLVDAPNINEILTGVPLGDAWYSGILGGVPAEP